MGHPNEDKIRDLIIDKKYCIEFSQKFGKKTTITAFGEGFTEVEILGLIEMHKAKIIDWHIIRGKELEEKNDKS